MFRTFRMSRKLKGWTFSIRPKWTLFGLANTGLTSYKDQNTERRCQNYIAVGQMVIIRYATEQEESPSALSLALTELLISENRNCLSSKTSQVYSFIDA